MSSEQVEAYENERLSKIIRLRPSVGVGKSCSLSVAKSSTFGSLPALRACIVRRPRGSTTAFQALTAGVPGAS